MAAFRILRGQTEWQQLGRVAAARKTSKRRPLLCFAVSWRQRIAQPVTNQRHQAGRPEIRVQPPNFLVDAGNSSFPEPVAEAVQQCDSSTRVIGQRSARGRDP